MTDTADTTTDIQDTAEGLQDSIRERLAELSSATDTPTDFSSAAKAVDAANISFDDGTWVQALVDNQGWLRLPTALTTAPVPDFVRQLVEALEIDADVDATAVFERLPASGLAALDDRLEKAVECQRVFLDAYLSDTGSRAGATSEWADAWGEELESEEDETVGVVQATTEAWHIVQFVNSDLNLTPSYQRGDVWSSTVRQSLIESILRGIPLPSIILLKPDDPRLPYEVVDGKQRLTAILRFVCAHPRATKLVEEVDAHHDQKGELERLFRSDYLAFKRKWKTLRNETLSPTLESKYFFPFKLRARPKSLSSKGTTSPLDALWGKYYTQIREEQVGEGSATVLVRQLFERAPKYKVPVIEYSQTHPRQIHEVFNLYNKQGVHLNAEEIRNAIYHELEITRALLVASGDAEAEIANVPSLENISGEVFSLGKSMTDYQFSPTRYKRTKVLSWIVASLLQPGKAGVATAKHIDDLLDRVQGNSDDPLHGAGTLEDLFRWIAASVESHAGAGEEMWAPAFRTTGKGKGWQELQLVGSVIGVSLVHAAHPDDAEQMLEDATDRLREESETARLGWKKSMWARPDKSQNREQWQCIARIATAVTGIVGVDTAVAHEAITRKYGFSGVKSLLADTGNDAIS